MKNIIIQGHPGTGNLVTGYALVANDNFSARYDLDRKIGIFSRPKHKLYKQSFVDKILVLNVAKGGVATAWMFKTMIDNKMAPKGLLLNTANPIIAQGAVHANLTLIDRFKKDITSFLKTGDNVIVDPLNGYVQKK